MSKWYVLRSRHELATRDDLADRGFYSYVPCERVKRRLGRKLHTVDRPVWRGYLFVLCDQQDLSEVNLAAGAQDFVRYAAAIGENVVAFVPVTLAIHLLDPIMAAEASGDLDYAKTFTPQLGDAVRVKSGKWKGYLGRIVALSKRKLTIAGEQGFFGRVQIEPEHLTQAPEEQHLAA